MERNRITEIVRQLGLYSGLVIADTVSKFEQLDYASIDDEKFDRWFNPEIYKQARNPGSYFIASVRRELSRGTFRAEQIKESNSVSDPAPELSSVEDFEKEWDTWCDVVRGLSLNPEMPDSPSLGVLAVDIGNRVRGVSTGDGGFVYIDGTESKRFGKFEDLDLQEKEKLIAAAERLHSNLIGANAVIQKMKSLIGGIENGKI